VILWLNGSVHTVKRICIVPGIIEIARQLYVLIVKKRLKILIIKVIKSNLTEGEYYDIN
jgi:hypothetical protein